MMNKFTIMNKFIIIMLVLAIAVTVTSCSSNNTSPNTSAAPQARGQNRSRGQIGYGNLTPEERQQMIATAIQQATEACQDKSVGDSCIIQNSRYNRTGICNIQNSTLLCNATINRQRPPIS